jgi:hypothetical protein
MILHNILKFLLQLRVWLIVVQKLYLFKQAAEYLGKGMEFDRFDLKCLAYLLMRPCVLAFAELYILGWYFL